MNTKPMAKTSAKRTSLTALAALTTTALLGTSLLSGCGGQFLSGKAFTQFTFITIPAPSAPTNREGSVRLPIKRDLEFSGRDATHSVDANLEVRSADRSYQGNETYRVEPWDQEISTAVLKVNFVAESSSAFSGTESKYKVSVIDGSGNCILKFLQAGTLINDSCGRGVLDGFSFYLTEAQMTRVVQTFTNPEQSEPYEIDINQDQPLKLKIHKSLSLPPKVYDWHTMLVVANAPAIEFLAQNRAGVWESRAFGLLKRHCHSPELDNPRSCDDLANDPGQAGHLLKMTYRLSNYFNVGFDLVRYLSNQVSDPRRLAFERFVLNSASEIAQIAINRPRDTLFKSEFLERFIGTNLTQDLEVQLPSAQNANDETCLALPEVPLLCQSEVPFDQRAEPDSPYDRGRISDSRLGSTNVTSDRERAFQDREYELDHEQREFERERELDNNEYWRSRGRMIRPSRDNNRNTENRGNNNERRSTDSRSRSGRDEP